jgi:hypothetical protein
MSAGPSPPTRRSLLAASASGSAAGLGLLASSGHARTDPAAEHDAIRPFRISVPEEELADLRSFRLPTFRLSSCP